MLSLQREIDEAKVYNQIRAWVEAAAAGYEDIEELIADCPVYAPEGLIREIVSELEVNNE